MWVPQPSSSLRTRDVQSKVTQRYRDRLFKVYSSCNNKKICKIDSLLRKWKGREHDLYLLVCAKYGFPPKAKWPPERGTVPSSHAATLARDRGRSALISYKEEEDMMRGYINDWKQRVGRAKKGYYSDNYSQAEQGSQLRSNSESVYPNSSVWSARSPQPKTTPAADDRSASVGPARSRSSSASPKRGHQPPKGFGAAAGKPGAPTNHGMWTRMYSRDNRRSFSYLDRMMEEIKPSAQAGDSKQTSLAAFHAASDTAWS